MACTQETIDEQTAIRVDAPETIKVGFEDSETRIQLNEAQKTVWTKNDLVSVFYKSNANQKWEYRGETGERVASLYRVDAGNASRDMDYVVLAYPYSSDYVISTTTGNIEAKLPATQYYAEGSYGVGSNLMVSQSEFTQFSLKSVCGWLKLQLTGNGEVVNSIKFRGNDGEQVAGLIYVDTATAEATLAAEMGGSDDNNAGGNLIFDDTIITEVTLDCGEGVTLGAEATSFYIALPPQTFANGFTVEIESDGYKPMTLSTENALTIERNTIQPMASVECDATPNVPYNEIWYTNGSTTEPTEPYKTHVFGANIISNTYDTEKECWVIKFDGDVTKIGDRAFDHCSSLKSVTIPDSVTTIGDSAFYYCSGLTSVTIGDSVTTIKYGAFAHCSNLISITIPDSVTTIGNLVFYQCSRLTSVTIGDSLTAISYAAFRDCYRLTDIYLGNNVTTIGGSAFYNCSSLTSVTIPDGVTTIEEETFYNCSSLTSITIHDSVTTIGDSAFSGCSSLTSVTIPDNITVIEAGTFGGCSGLTSITIPDGVTKIGSSAFSGCSNLTSVTIPDGVTTIGGSAFRDCRSLTSITIPDNITVIEAVTFCGCSSITSITIPDGVTKIGSSAFSGCSNLTSVTIPDNITVIEGGTFSGCSSLASITIPDGVTTIGEDAFRDCRSLTSVTIPDSVTTIGEDAFYYCSSLTSITIPDSVTSIGYWAFVGCSSLTNIHISDLSAWCKIDFGGDNANPLCKQANLYLNNKLVTELVVPSDITEIKSYAFDGYNRLTSVTIPDSVTTIGNAIFCGCSNLTEFNGKFSSEDGKCLIIDGVLNSFAPSGITNYTIPDSVTTIGDYAFSKSSSLKYVTIPNSVTTIKKYAFNWCYNLTSITLPNSIAIIENDVFDFCWDLISIYCKAIVPPIVNSETFSGSSSNCTIYVPIESVEVYKSADGWSEFADAIVGYNF